MKNNLIVIENGQLNTYLLDTRVSWEVGRLSKDNTPDIAMHATTVSRRQGKFQNMDGIWFYMDYNPTNRTFRNGRKLTGGLNGRVRPVMVSDGDSFMFGGGDEPIVDWKDDAAEMRSIPSAVIANYQHFMEPGVTWSTISGGQIGVRRFENGFIFDNKGECLFADSEQNLDYFAGFLNSNVAMCYLKFLSPTLDFNCGYISRLPIINTSYIKEIIINTVGKNVKISKNDWDSNETSWDFKCHPLLSVIPRNSTLFDDTNDIDLAECYTCWENECNERFNQLKANEEELNRIFIDIYGLQDELTPEVEDKDVTVRKADLQRDIKSLVSYAVGCMFGRYSLDEEGLVLAGQPFEAHFFEASAPVCGTGFAGAPGASVLIGEFYYKTDDGVKKCTYNPDKDNIIPICDEEYFSDDIVSRFCEWVKIVYGEKSLETNLDFIAEALGNKGNTSREVIRNYFLNDFFNCCVKRR